jgi:hypothetical protein
MAAHTQAAIVATVRIVNKKFAHDVMLNSGTDEVSASMKLSH